MKKNRKEIPNALRLMIETSTVLLQISPNELRPARSYKTLASTLKFEIDSLIKDIEKTVSNKPQLRRLRKYIDIR